MSLIALAQGVPFFHAGDDILRSKSLDRNSYNSGDWYNAIDWTLETDNWGNGLPPSSDNSGNYPIMQPLLANPNLAPSAADREFATAVFREFLSIRRSSPLFRLQTADEIMANLMFLNTGSEQVPGVIVMRIADNSALDPAVSEIVVVFNATPDTIDFTAPEDIAYTLHDLQANGVDAVTQESTFANGAFSVPGRTTAVFVAGE